MYLSLVGNHVAYFMHAHKYVLATSSAVFFAMFYGEIPPKEFPIRIEDAEEESFKEFLRFLYTDDCKITARERDRNFVFGEKVSCFVFDREMLRNSRGKH